MSGTLLNLIIQIVAGVIGGNAVGAGLKDVNLGTLGNTIAGAIGGAGGGQILQAIIPVLAGATGGSLDIGALVGQAAGGGVGWRDLIGRRRTDQKQDGFFVILGARHHATRAAAPPAARERPTSSCEPRRYAAAKLPLQTSPRPAPREVHEFRTNFTHANFCGSPHIMSRWCTRALL